MTRTITRTTAGIAGGGPAGLMLSHAGIASAGWKYPLVTRFAQIGQ